VKVFEVLSVFWLSCGVTAFATHVVRRRARRNRKELTLQLIGATVLGVIALIGVLTNADNSS
jgi:hypothetical protein